MARGGARVGAGRPSNPNSVRAKRAAKRGLKVVETDPVKKTKPAKKKVAAIAAAQKAPVVTPGDPPAPTGDHPPQVPETRDPLEYMLAVMNDPTADKERRDRMALAAAPFLHSKVGESGKKQQRSAAAKTASTGRFAPSAPPPRLVANNR